MSVQTKPPTHTHNHGKRPLGRDEDEGRGVAVGKMVANAFNRTVMLIWYMTSKPK